MENATKALLIAAAVLIVIVIIALGVRLLGTAGDTSRQADELASQISNSTSSAAGKVQDELSKLYSSSSGGSEMSASEFNAQFSAYVPEWYLTKEDIKELANLIINSNNNSSHKITIFFYALGEMEWNEINPSYLKNRVRDDCTYQTEISATNQGYIKNIKIREYSL